MRKLIVLTLAAFLSLAAFSQNLPQSDTARWQPDETLAYSGNGEEPLEMDVYLPSDSCDSHKCVLFIYGGGFINNNLRAYSTRQFCRQLADDGFVAVAMDYRLGLKGVKYKTRLGMIKPLGNAVSIAVQDCGKAIAYLLANAERMKINPEEIILCGSSAGAITALQTDYELCNRTENVACVPEDFRPAGVVSFAGAVFSHEGKVSYKLHSPAPTLLLHGTSDQLVSYDKIALGSTRFSGSNDLVKVFKANHYPHLIIRYVDEGHGVAARTMDSYRQMMWFIDNMVTDGHNYEMDLLWNDHDHESVAWDRSRPDNLYN